MSTNDTRKRSFGKCYDCNLIGVDKDAETIVREGDRTIPVCWECAKAYVFFIEENGTEEGLPENDDYRIDGG